MGQMGLTPPKFEYLACGWREKLVFKATDKPTSIKDVVIMAEAREFENEKPKEKTRRLNINSTEPNKPDDFMFSLSQSRLLQMGILHLSLL